MATVNSEITFFDTSVFVAGIVAIDPNAIASRTIMTAAFEGHLDALYTAWHCCLEFYSVVTRLPPEYRLSTGDALKVIKDGILPCFLVKQLPQTAHAEFIDAISGENISGRRIYDAHIGHVANEAGATIVVTENRRDFTTLLSSGIRVLTSAEYLASTDLNK